LKRGGNRERHTGTKAPIIAKENVTPVTRKKRWGTKPKPGKHKITLKGERGERRGNPYGPTKGAGPRCGESPGHNKRWVRGVRIVGQVNGLQTC